MLCAPCCDVMAPIIYGIVIAVVICFDFVFISCIGRMNMLLYPFQIISHFIFSIYMTFTMHRYIVKAMYLEKAKMTYNLDWRE